MFCLPQGSDGGVVTGTSDVGSVKEATGAGRMRPNGTAGAAMLMVYVKVATSAVGTVLSVTSMATFVLPATVGVPVKTPAALRLRPAGNPNDAGSRLQVKGGVPPCCRRVVEAYGRSMTPLGNDWVVIVMLRGRRMFRLIVKRAEAAPKLSVAIKKGV
jgi:hypothetical protein